MNPSRRELPRRSRASCLELLAVVLEHPPAGVRGTAVFVIDSDRRPSGVAGARHRFGEDVLAEVARRLGAAAPPWHRLALTDADEFIVIAQGLADGSALLAAAARLVHAYDDALDVAGLQGLGDASVGIAFAPQHGRRADSLLAAAEHGLREALAAARQGKRGGVGLDASSFDPTGR